MDNWKVDESVKDGEAGVAMVKNRNGDTEEGRGRAWK